MKIEFKYKPGDQVWLMYDNKARLGTITKCCFGKYISCADFETVSDGYSYEISVDEKKIGIYGDEWLFPDKESLINSL